jgi:hypothetical protein
LTLRSGVLGLLLTACARPDATRGWQGSIDTLANGAVVVHNEGRGLWDSTTVWRVRQDLRIGTPGVGQQAFTHVVALEVDRWGRMYVLERDAQEIRVFDSTGVFVRTIGRRGKGPGEFTLANGLAWSPAGQLWVVDQRNERFTLFDTAGRVLDMRPRRLGFSGWRWEGAADSTGRLFENQFGRGNRVTQILLRFDLSSERVDTFPLGWLEAPIIKSTLSNGGYGGGPLPFSPKVVWRVDPPGRLWLAVTNQYRIVQRALRGDTLRIVERVVPPVALSRMEIDSAVAAWVTALAGPAGNTGIRSQVEGAPFPKTKPALSAFFIDDFGRLWVQPYVAAREPANVFDVFDREGRFLGRLGLPFPVLPYSPTVFRGDRLYTVTEDAEGIPYVVRAKIIKPSGTP